MSEPITVHEGQDGELYAERWPNETLVEPYVIYAAKRGVLELHGSLTIRVKNGMATYDLLGVDNGGNLECRLVDSHWEPMP